MAGLPEQVPHRTVFVTQVFDPGVLEIPGEWLFKKVAFQKGFGVFGLDFPGAVLYTVVLLGGVAGK